MAVVFLARDAKHSRDVAAKVIRPELAEALGRERFLREIEIVAGLRHPHIVPLYDSGESDGALYYVMPFEDGHSLRQRIDRDGPLSVRETIVILRELCDALGYAHKRGVIHRDIKPENVLLSGEHAMITDFGIARAVPQGLADSSVNGLAASVREEGLAGRRLQRADRLDDVVANDRRVAPDRLLEGSRDHVVRRSVHRITERIAQR